MLNLAEYKRRQAAPGVKVTLRNFGRDRRYPIVNRFRDPGTPLPKPGHVARARLGREKRSVRLLNALRQCSFARCAHPGVRRRDFFCLNEPARDPGRPRTGADARRRLQAAAAGGAAALRGTPAVAGLAGPGRPRLRHFLRLLVGHDDVAASERGRGD